MRRCIFSHLAWMIVLMIIVISEVIVVYFKLADNKGSIDSGFEYVSIGIMIYMLILFCNALFIDSPALPRGEEEV